MPRADWRREGSASLGTCLLAQKITPVLFPNVSHSDKRRLFLDLSAGATSWLHLLEMQHACNIELSLNVLDRPVESFSQRNSSRKDESFQIDLTRQLINSLKLKKGPSIRFASFIFQKVFPKTYGSGDQPFAEPQTSERGVCSTLPTSGKDTAASVSAES